ncbi:metal ABC transporter solute-binding protein, Zn/Mn family [Algivirga pacifica]|uniref:Manganese ABC transporter substrate-binding protein/adhesin MntA n=1 Tax=Algivirga pacifica TaxID=1162670 RepID=A0ABP9D6C8_9BACT
MKQFIYFLFAFSLVFTSCSKTKKESTKESLKIVTTTGMIGDALKNIVGDKAEVISLMGVGVDPHLYKATPSDLKALREADIIFYNGLHLEGNMAEVLEKLSKRKAVFALADGLSKEELRSSNDGSTVHDPHIWFNVALWSKGIQYASEQLIQAAPEQSSFYQANTQQYLQELAALHTWVGEEIQKIPVERRVLITAHDAFGYFGDAYAIEVRGLQGISTVAEVGLRDVTILVKYIVEKKIKAVFVESSIPKKALEAVVSGCQQKKHTIEIGGVLYSDAMGAANTPSGTYIGMVKSNVNTIVDALK